MSRLSAFEEFWKAYPRKVGKALCRAKFAALVGDGLRTTVDGQKLLLKSSEDDLVKAAKAFWYDMPEDQDPRFIPHPATWLNQGRYEDIDDERRDELAAKYDALQERIKPGLRVVG